MIRNIVFDIGEILMGYRWTYALEVSGLSVEEGNRVGKLIFENPIWDEMDAGNVTLAQAKEMYHKAYPEDAK
ncbi:MAG: HAD family phosphatase, partial [Lachnospiraceae bacterium]|nr:HAD family phosphatase [Lachnospiraceae bacterium]